MDKDVTYNFIKEDFHFNAISLDFIFRNSIKTDSISGLGRIQLDFVLLEENFARINYFTATEKFHLIVKLENQSTLSLFCSCGVEGTKMCEHEANTLLKISDSPSVLIFFDEKTRKELFEKEADKYDLDENVDLTNYFVLKRKDYGGNEIELKNKSVIPINQNTKEEIKDLIVTNSFNAKNLEVKSKEILVFGFDKYAEGIIVGLYEAQLTKEGELKNPLDYIYIENRIFESEDAQIIKFYSALKQLSGSTLGRSFKSTLKALEIIVSNPLDFALYFHQFEKSQRINVNTIYPVEFSNETLDFKLLVDVEEPFYKVRPQLSIRDKKFPNSQHQFILNHFVAEDKKYYLINDISVYNMINYFNKKGGEIIFHESKYKEFQTEVLDVLENKIKIEYTFLKKASQSLLVKERMNEDRKVIIYLSELNDFILITPVIKYGKTEVPLLSKRQIKFTDTKGGQFYFERDESFELYIFNIIVNQHKEFEKQNGQEFFYVSTKKFMENGWFVNAFEEWKNNDFEVLGFNKLAKVKINPHKMKVSLQVNSGIDWFEVHSKVKFGDQNVSLKELQKAIKNQSKYVLLGDGTEGLLPDEWLRKFAEYFRNGEVQKDTIKIHKSNFSTINTLFETEMLSQNILEEIKELQSKTKQFKKINKVEVPKTIKAELRNYQKEGLNWLNFLDEFRFGGCLADDMGLGKTLQILTFITSLRKKKRRNCNLVILPTSLLFNWENEIKKFAPDIRFLQIYGSNRVIDKEEIYKYEIVLTTYGSLLNDVTKLKEIEFNYIILDESQMIKNPESQRYKAVKLLKSYNKLVLTGTPIENNTFDLYAQLSFAIPGLLGSKQHFKDNFSTPIDKFKDISRAKELQEKVNPFILRRTKSQVAQELPDKTEMVLYCEMGQEQRAVYDAFRNEVKEYLNASTESKKNLDTVYILAALTKMRQICNSPALLNDDAYYGGESAKIQVLMDEINERKSYHKILVFSQFTSMLDLVQTELIKEKVKFAYLSGSTKNREEVVNSFKEDDEVRVFLISLKAGGTGLNLTEADYVYLIDPWWNPAVENQAIDRCYRIGQEKHVMAVRLITPNSIEEKIMDLQRSKKDLAADLIHTDASIFKSLSREDILNLF